MTFIGAETRFVPDESAIAKADDTGHIARRERDAEFDDLERQIRDSSNPLLSRMRPEDVQRVAIALCRSFGDVIVELHELLKQYGPSWYSQQQYQRTERAIRLIRCL